MLSGDEQYRMEETLRPEMKWCSAQSTLSGSMRRGQVEFVQRNIFAVSEERCCVGLTNTLRGIDSAASSTG
jgi:hypothetical protein